MALVSKSDFNDWYQNPVTKAFFEACRNRVDDAKDTLAAVAGLDSNEDNMLRGMIRAYSEIPDFRIDDLEEVEV